ncbi:iron chaperone [Paenibacillus sp. HJGM_3]|uniref:iron chaperone n=1 Tax=Paenibacillus sp. HJGM_3 TaxID=3379816 RepID=UPI00385DB9DC
MADAKSNFQSVDEYIVTFPQDVQAILEQIRQTIREAVPEAEEVISYQLPAYKYHGMLIYFSAYKAHTSLSFPPPFTVFEVFRDRLAPYDVSKSAVKFPLASPFPYDLLTDMVKFRAEENREKESKKKKK